MKSTSLGTTEETETKSAIVPQLRASTLNAVFLTS